MKILEAWARGVPVVATPEAVAGLGIEPGRELLVADDGEEFAAAIELLHRDTRHAVDLTHAGRALLAERHRPEAIADELLALYTAVA
jgi:glycosyltransferase involved in cell wall biosynthesis